MTYDRDNIFARILRGEIPCKKVYEDDHVLALYDIQPKAPVHVLVIPKGEYISHDDFARNATEAELVAMTRAIGKIVRELDIASKGYRLIVNNGVHGGQEVPHYHIHILGGADVGPMVSR